MGSRGRLALRLNMAVLVTALCWDAISQPIAKPHRATMETAEILQMVEFVVKAQLKLERAERFFGPAERRTDTQIILRPQDRRFDLVILETPANSPDIVISVSLRFINPSPIDLTFFNKLYGEPRILPRLKPNQPTSYVFGFTYGDKRGQLLLGVRDNLLTNLKVDRFD